MEPSNTEPCDGSSSSLNHTHSGMVTTLVPYSPSLQVTKLFGTVVEHQLANNINGLALTVISDPNFKTYENDFIRQERSDPAFQDEICSLVADPAVIKSMEEDVMVQEFATKMKEKIKEKMKSHPKPDVPPESKMKEKMEEKMKEKMKSHPKPDVPPEEKMNEKMNEKMKSHPKPDVPPKSNFNVIWEGLMDIVELTLRDHQKEAIQLGLKIMTFLSRNIKVILVRFNRLITLSLPGGFFGFLKLLNPTYMVYFATMMLVVILAINIYGHVYHLGNA